MNNNVVVIGIAGGTSSGKTTLIDRIREEFGEKISIISLDFYYKCLDHLTMEERNKVNYDHPDSFDMDLLVEHVKKLKNGEAIEHPTYDYTIHNRTKEWVMVEPSKVIIVEGILTFVEPKLRELFDIKIFVDCEADVRILRRIIRDTNDRGRTVESVVNQYLTTVKPMHDQFIEPTKKYADIIVPEGGHNKVALEMISHRIRSLLAEN